MPGYGEFGYDDRVPTRKISKKAQKIQTEILDVEKQIVSVDIEIRILTDKRKIFEEELKKLRKKCPHEYEKDIKRMDREAIVVCQVCGNRR